MSYNREPEQVLVSRRYTTVTNPTEAAKLSLNASAERHGYEQDDEGNLLRMAVNEVEVACPCWVERVDRVTK